MKIVILGSGQIGNAAASIARENGHDVLGFIDDNPELKHTSVYDLPVLGNRESLLNNQSFDAVCIGVGTIKARKAVANWLKERNIQTVSAIHPSVVMSPEVKLGRNLIIGTNSTFFINPKIGDGCFIGPSVTVSHDTVVGDYCLLSVGSVIGARCDIGNEVLIGSAATLMPPAFSTEARLSVGEGAIVGVGATVIRDVEKGSTVVGTPAKPITPKA